MSLPPTPGSSQPVPPRQPVYRVPCVALQETEGQYKRVWARILVSTNVAHGAWSHILLCSWNQVPCQPTPVRAVHLPSAAMGHGVAGLS